MLPDRGQVARGGRVVKCTGISVACEMDGWFSTSMPIRLNNADDQAQPAAWTGELVQVGMIRHPSRHGSNLSKTPTRER